VIACASGCARAVRERLHFSPATVAGAGGISPRRFLLAAAVLCPPVFLRPDTAEARPLGRPSGEGLSLRLRRGPRSGRRSAGVVSPAAGSTSDTAQRCAVCVEPGHQTKDGGRRRGESRGAQVAAPNGSGQIRGGRSPARGEAERSKGRRGRGDGPARGRRRNPPPGAGEIFRPRQAESTPGARRACSHRFPVEPSRAAGQRPSRGGGRMFANVRGGGGFGPGLGNAARAPRPLAHGRSARRHPASPRSTLVRGEGSSNGGATMMPGAGRRGKTRTNRPAARRRG
jgi:hypothetical protein